ncbi:MAG: PAS domain S-box protein [Chloroflexales bacterium]|nr:PAS domain S-box protein [Chloroflexales bacterium]
MRSRPLLSQVTPTYLAALSLVALFAISGFGASQLGAYVQRDHQVLINLSSRQVLLVERGALLATLLTEPAASEVREAQRARLRAVGAELATNHRHIQAAGLRIPWWLPTVVPLSSNQPVRPPDVESLLSPFLVHIEALAAEPDARLTQSQADRVALLGSYAPLVARLEAAAGWYDLLSWIDSAAVIRLQALSLILVLGLLAVEAFVIFRPMFRELANEQRELALLSLVASQTDNGVIITDELGRVVWINEGLTRISGYTLAELEGHTTGAIQQGPASDPATIKALGEALWAGEPIAAEIVNYHKSGRPYWLAISITPVRGPHGRVERFIAIESDITERKELEESLRASLKDLADVRFALDQAAIVAITDQEGAILEANDLFCQISGYSRGELIGQTHHIINSKYHDQAFWRDLWGTIEQGKVWRGEIRNCAKDGRLYWVYSTIVPFLNEAGKPTRYLAVRFDISERKRAEQALRERTMRLQLRADIAAIVGGTTDEGPIIAGVITELACHFPDVRVAYSTIDEYGQLTVLCSREPAGMPSLAEMTVDLHMAPAYLDALCASETLIVGDVANDVRLAPLGAALAAGGTYALLDVPVEHSAGLVGLLCFDAPQPRLWSKHEAVTLREVADYLSLALHDAYIQRERARAEAALRASEEHLRFQKTLLECQGEASPEGLLVVGTDGRVLSINRRFLELWALPEELLTLGTRADRMAMVTDRIDDGAAFAARIEELYANPAMVANDEIYLRDGRTFERYSAPVRSADGELFGRFWSYRDITARVAAEAALRTSEATNRALLDALPDLMFRVRADGLFLDYRASRNSDLAVPPEVFLGRRIAEVFPQELADILMAAVATTLATGTLQLVEYALPVGEVMRDYEARLTPIGGDKALVIVRDISERKASDRLKNEFVAMVSHELRTPLTAIRGSLGLISGGVAGALAPQVRAMIDIAHKNSERLVRLINDILDIEKIESGKMSFHRGPLDLGHLLAQTIEATSAYGAQYGVSFALEPAPETQIFADADRMVQVFTNLLSNAAKFSPPGEAVLVRVSRHEGMVRVGVSDHGPGIPESFHDHIFQKFAQADSSTTRAKGGTGLGLSIVRAIVERHGGSVSFESEPGAGATFFVDLPEWRPVASAAMVLPVGRVLVCEDDPDVAHLLTLMLQQAGFAAEVAYSADDMRAHLASGSYDVLTLDIRLQHQDGVELIRELRARAATARLPIIVVSGQVEQAREDLGDSVSLVDWLAKPIDPALLVAAVTQAVRHGPSGAPRVLHIDDDPDVVHVVASLISDVATVIHAETLAEARARIAEAHFDLAIVDLVLPDGSGLEVLPALGAQRPPTPAVLFSVHELDPALTGQAAITLVKSRVTNQELRDTIIRLLAAPCPRAGNDGVSQCESI